MAEQIPEDSPDSGRESGLVSDPIPNESLFDAPPLGEQERMVEAILFASAEPVTVAELNARMPHGADAAAILPLLQKRYEGRGIRVVRVGEAWAIRTAPDLGFLMHKETVETRKLSRAAIETLAIVAYHQPVTRAEIEEIRGVSVSRGTVDQLLELEWIRFGRRRETPGRPVTYVVTPGFLDHFGLESARDLPGLRDLRAAGLLDNRPPPGAQLDGAPDDQPELFEGSPSEAALADMPSSQTLPPNQHDDADASGAGRVTEIPGPSESSQDSAGLDAEASGPGPDTGSPDEATPRALGPGDPQREG